MANVLLVFVGVVVRRQRRGRRCPRFDGQAYVADGPTGGVPRSGGSVGTASRRMPIGPCADLPGLRLSARVAGTGTGVVAVPRVRDLPSGGWRGIEPVTITAESRAPLVPQ